MSKIVELLEEQIKASNEFPKNNFGLKVGKEWPEFVGDMLSAKEVKTQLAFGFMMSMLLGGSVADKTKNAPDGDPHVLDRIAEDPIVYDLPLKFLFWGIQIGKQLAEVETLEAMHAEPK